MSSKKNIYELFTKEEKEFYLELSKFNQKKFEDIIYKREELSGKDFLTGLYNRNTLDFRINNLLSGFKRREFENKENDSFNLIFFDIDHFKKINDNYGHNIGDEILKEYSYILKKHKKREEDSIFRYGGEEFLYILQDSNLNFGLKFTKNLKKNLKKNIAIIETNEGIKGVNLNNTRYKNYSILENITSSFGIINYNESFNNYKELNKNKIIKAVDNALYNSKNTGRDKISYIINNYEIKELT